MTSGVTSRPAIAFSTAEAVRPGRSPRRARSLARAMSSRGPKSCRETDSGRRRTWSSTISHHLCDRSVRQYLRRRRRVSSSRERSPRLFSATPCCCCRYSIMVITRKWRAKQVGELRFRRQRSRCLVSRRVDSSRCHARKRWSSVQGNPTAVPYAASAPDRSCSSALSIRTR